MTDDTPGRLRFDTDALPVRDRFPFYCEAVVRRYTALDIKTQDERQFRGVLEMQRVGVIELAAFSTTPVEYERTSSLVRDGDDGLIFALPQSGMGWSLTLTQFGTHEVAAGGGITYDCGYTGHVTTAADSRFLVLKVPRPRIAGLLPRASRLAGARLDRDPVARQLLCGYLGGTYDIDLSGGGRAVELYDQHIVDLISLALGAQDDARALAELGGGRAVRRAAVLREIENLVGDPGLNAIAVALRLGITPRYVHILLEETGRSFTQHVLEKRLQLAAALLRDPRRHDRRIADIALEAGFADLSHFNRAFRRRFGDTPTGVRADARRPSDEE